MISLRVFKGSTVAILTVALVVACSDGPMNPSAAHRNGMSASGATSVDAKAGSTGSSAKDGAIDARVLLDKSGNAVLEVRTGTFDDRTNSGDADGIFESIQYKVLSGSGKQVVVRNVNFNGTSTSKYVTMMNLCSNGDDGDDDHHSSGCNMKFGSDWSVSVQANVKDDDHRTDVVRADASVGYLPDIDLSKQSIFTVDKNGAQSRASTVAAGTPTTFSVTIPNDKSISGVANTTGAQTSCIVTVDNSPQLPLPSGQYDRFTNPNAFGYIGTAIQNIPAGASAPCQFTLTLPEGTHQIVVTAGVLYPGDYDLTNNSTSSFIVTASSAPTVPVTVDLAAQPLQRVGDGVNASSIISLDTAKVNKTVTIRAVFANASTTATAVDCAINANGAINAQPVGSVANVSAPAGGSAICQYSVNAIALGNFPISVTATPTSSSPKDPNPANNTASGTMVVRASGSFSDLNGTFNIFQDWTNPASAPAWPIATTLDHQVFQSSQISLLVLPTQGTIGTFSLHGTVTSGLSTFGTGAVPSQTLRAANAGEQVCITVGPAASLGNAAEPSLVYFAQICTQQASIPGMQAITVNYTQSVNGAVPAGSNPLAFTGGVAMNLQLDFTLAGSSSADRATATVRAPVVNQATNCMTSFDLSGQTCSTQFGAPVVTTP